MASEDWILDTVVGFLHSPVWTVPIMTFIEENCIVFDPSEENTLEYTEIHNRYKEMVEYLLESFIEDLQIDAEAFVKACHSKVPGAAESTLILFEQVMAAESFIVFKTMMVQHNIELELQTLRLIKKRNGVVPPALRPGHDETAGCNQDFIDEDEILQKIMKQSEAEYKQQQAAKTVDKNLDSVLASSKEEAERLEMEKKREEEIMKKVIEESKQDLLKQQQSIEQMESETLRKVLKMSLSEQEMMVAKAAAVSQTSLQGIPQISTSEKKTRSESKKTSKATSSKPPPLSPRGSSSEISAPSSSSKTKPSAGKPPPSKDISGSDAAASWLSSARAEAAASVSKSGPTSSTYASDAAELKKREAYLKQQRDQLMAMKKKEREKSLNNFSKNEDAKSRPKSSRAARNATTGEMQVKSNDQEAEDKKMKMRMALAERLKKEVIQK